MLPTRSVTQALYLGQIAPDVATVERMVWDRRKWLEQDSELSEARRQAMMPLLFAEYLRVVESFGRLAKVDRQRTVEAANVRATGVDKGRLYVMGHEDPAALSLIRQGLQDDFTPDFEGWLRYLYSKGPFQKALESPQYQRNSAFAESGREEHTLIVAPTKWGKSELIKALAWHTIQPPDNRPPSAALVVLDPGGDLVRQLARWPELSGPDRATDRLIYIEPDLTTGLAVGINPLDGTGLDHRGRNHVAGMLAEAIGTLTADLTVAMHTLVMACSTVLLGVPGATLRDLLRMLREPAQDQRAGELYDLALAYRDDPDLREWFRFEFNGKGYEGTKVYLRNRLNDLFANSDFGALFGGRETVNLRQAVDARKVVLVNLAKLGNSDAVATAGRLLVAIVGAIGRSRAQHAEDRRVPVHLIVDEATVLAGNELVRMLAELRKWGVYLTLAQQVMGSGFSAEDKATLTANTGCRFIGGRDKRMLSDMLMIGREAADLPAIERGQFWVEWPGMGGPHLLNVRSDLAGNARSVTAEEWAKYVTEITSPDGYYRPAKPVSEGQPDGLRDALSDDETPAPEIPVASINGLPKPTRKSKTKPLDVVVKTPKVRASKAIKPIAPKSESSDVRPSGRKLD